LEMKTIDGPYRKTLSLDEIPDADPAHPAVRSRWH
jgi:hypothetical protein